MEPINHHRGIHHEGQAVMHVCGCGRLHFNYGPITLHFEREEFVAFAEQVGRLAVQVQRMMDGRGPVLLPSRTNMSCH